MGIEGRPLRITLQILVLVWGLIFIAAFVFRALMEPTGDGYTHGANRAVAFVTWHFFGFLVALVAAWLTQRGRAQLSRGMQFLGYIPLLIDILLILIGGIKVATA